MQVLTSYLREQRIKESAKKESLPEIHIPIDQTEPVKEVIKEPADLSAWANGRNGRRFIDRQNKKKA